MPKKVLKIGLFHPPLNICGGAEHVAITMMNSLKQCGHTVITLGNKKVDQSRIYNMFGKKISIDREVILPLSWLPVYANVLQSFTLKFKCDVLIDTHSKAMFPWTDIIYFNHLPFLERFHPKHLFSYLYHLPYKMLIKQQKNLDRKVILATSATVAKAIKETMGVDSTVLYPPVRSKYFHPRNMSFEKDRKDRVVTVGRFSSEKNLEIIPYIAKLTGGDISFIIVGRKHDEKVLCSVSKLIKTLRLSKKIKILTNVTREELRVILWESKVYLHTCINEAFGISIVEAMAAGCSPIVYNSGGPREYVPENLRYETTREAVEIIEKAVDEWSPNFAKQMIDTSDRFNEKLFSKNFMGVIDSFAFN